MPSMGPTCGIYESRDNGKTWKRVQGKGLPQGDLGRIGLAVGHTDQGTRVYASITAKHDGGLYRSADGGQSWKRFDKVQVHGTIMSIGLHQSDPKQVYIGARYDGEVFGTQDAGKTWQAMPLPGEVQHIYSVACG